MRVLEDPVPDRFWNPRHVGNIGDHLMVGVVRTRSSSAAKSGSGEVGGGERKSATTPWTGVRANSSVRSRSDSLGRTDRTQGRCSECRAGERSTTRLSTS